MIYFVTGMVSSDELAVGWQYLAMLILVSCIALSYRPLHMRLYQQEQMSVLMPYSNLNKIFSVIISFFLFRDVSILSLCIILVAILVIA
ncbi:MAG: hypothetical protein H6765_02265 [Candidatus Peribacteria bacterium]|nr:MAG: hypothetical protein H6765_02265 [Candidatus Peribacteria bacterium]